MSCLRNQISTESADGDFVDANSVAEPPPNCPESSMEFSKTELYVLGEKFVKLSAALLIVWFVGWLGLSFAWILLGLAAYSTRTAIIEEKRAQLDMKVRFGH